MLTKPFNCKKFTDVVVFPTIPKIKDTTYDDYVCTREDNKMAPRTCSPGDNGRYHLRLAQKQQHSQSPIDAATVSNKIEFLRCMGLGLTDQEADCITCHQVNCVCEIEADRRVTMVSPQEDIISIKPCSVLITCERCKLCKRLFKCESDVRDHMKKEHKRKLKVVFKLHNQTVSTKWIKKRHLKRPRSNSINVVPSESSFNDAELENRLHSSDLERLENNSRPCSAPSLGVAYELPFCQGQHCACCVKNLRPMDDNNNSDCLKDYGSISRTGFTKALTPPLARSLQTIQSNLISSQTPDWMEDSMAVLDLSKKSNRTADDVIVLDDNDTQDTEVMEVPTEPPCYDLTDDESFHVDENFHGDDEVEKILEIRSNRMKPFTVPKIEDDSNSQGVRISEALRDLMTAENSLSNHNDDDVRESMETNDDEDDFTLRYDDSEESCTFTVKDSINDNKELSKSYSDNSFEDTYSDMAIDHYDALQQSSCFWRTPTKTVERFSEDICKIDKINNLQSSIAIKEEVMIDHYMWA